MISYTLIENEIDLKKFCSLLSDASILMIDTEFVKTRTYFATLSILQIFDGISLYIIDAIKIKNLDLIWLTLSNPDIRKVFHSSSEDLDIILNLSPYDITNIVDTQIMAVFLGLGLSVGFSKLCSQLLNINIDKSESRSNWLQRPLSDSQLRYAASDVYYLYPIYEKLNYSSSERGLDRLILSECNRLLEAKKQTRNSNFEYLKFNGLWKLQPFELFLLQKLAKWRVEEAIKRNIAVNFILREELLFKIIKLESYSINQLKKCGLNLNEMKHHGKQIITILSTMKDTCVSKYPNKILKIDDTPKYKKTHKEILKRLIELSEEFQIPREALFSKKMIKQLIEWAWLDEYDQTNLPVLIQSWRFDIVYKSVRNILEQN